MQEVELIVMIITVSSLASMTATDIPFLVLKTQPSPQTLEVVVPDAICDLDSTINNNRIILLLKLVFMQFPMS